MKRIALLLVLAACAERTPPPDEPMIDLDDDGRAEPASPPAAAKNKVAPARRRSGEIPRADLERVLAAGPGRLLARVEVKASVTGGRFIGWEVVRNPWDDVDLVAGDVILSVNGRTLEHPLELKVLWDDLRKANAIAVEVDRKGEKLRLDFTIVPAVAAPAPATP
jgi:type II secretory pathway component PulC